MNKRKLIREKVKELLINNTDCSSRVYENRFTAYWPGKMPAISIYTMSESAEIYNVAPRKYKRKISLAIEIIFEAKEDSIDDQMDLVCSQIEAILHTDDTLGGLSDEVIYQGTRFNIVQEDDGQVHSMARMEYEVHYASYHGIDPETLPIIRKHHANIKANDNIVESEIALDGTL